LNELKRRTVELDKKKKPTEPAAVEEELEQGGAAKAEANETQQPAADVQTDESAQVRDAEPETYTLTAEEFDAAKAHIETLQKEKDETVLLLQRVQADFDNFRRRNTSIRKDSYEEGKRDCIKELLPVLDSFDRAVASAAADDKNIQQGVALVQRQMLDALKKLGLCIIEAVMSEKVEGKDSGEVLQVLQKGYRVGDRIIRHCMVKVSE
jgi:molecular chaperone GrpE